MKRLLTIGLAIGCVGAALVSFAAPGDEVRVASLIEEMQGLTPSQLNALQPIEIRPYTLPDAGIDVMRARLEETYVIDGIGEDTVELTGWIAVRRENPRLAPGETELEWGNAIIDTQFIALELTGESKVFGPVKVSLDKDRPAYGQVGKIEMPREAHMALASLAKENAGEIEGALSPQNNDCTAPTNALVSLPALGIEMKTAEPAVWHSRVYTIPPVGQQASVTVKPVSLVAEGGRQVGTLVSGKISFREVVRQIEFQDDRRWTAVAAAQ